MADKKDKEVIAAITAAVQSMYADKVIAVKIKRNDIWAISARQAK
ncbi:MAG: methylmalonyl-CoA carboxyltransferase [Selenomonadaceae bacterium]|nr:methylmalonyl-CoA carboxyltransferase [Selenomonadaceae bacterium]MBP3723432.1 methylmalonyl-CoA carboxyltransferase [Selenomonadaceae bacterium]